MKKIIDGETKLITIERKIAYLLNNTAKYYRKKLYQEICFFCYFVSKFIDIK